MKEYIFNEFIKKLESLDDINNIINLLNCLEEKYKSKEEDEGNKEDENLKKDDKKKEKEVIIEEFLKKLMEKYLFTKEEFFSNSPNLNISLLYKLYKSGKIQNNEEEYYHNIVELLENIRKEIEGNLQKRKLDEFLKNDESEIIQRLSLINIILDTFNPNDVFQHLKKRNEDINQYINKLRNIKDNIIIYYKEFYQDKITQLIETIKGNQNKKIKEYKEGKIEGSKAKDSTEDIFFELEKKSDKIKEVKDFLLFNVIYDMNAVKDEENSFNFAYEKTHEIGNKLKEYAGKKKSIIELYNKYQEYFDKIKEKLSNNEERAQKFIKDLTSRYSINNESTTDELTILFKSKKYELDINSMIFFFNILKKITNLLIID